MTLPVVSEDLTTEGRSALIIPVRGLSDRVQRWRELTNPVAAQVPAHITVLVPFIPLAQLAPSDIAWLRARLASLAPPPLVLDAVDAFDSAVWLRPQPTDFFRELTQQIWRRWPAHPPYEGAFAEVVPHLTVAHGVDLLAAVRADLEPELPIRGEFDSVHLYAWTQGRWSDQAQFRFKASSWDKTSSSAAPANNSSAGAS